MKQSSESGTFGCFYGIDKTSKEMKPSIWKFPRKRLGEQSVPKSARAGESVPKSIPIGAVLGVNSQMIPKSVPKSYPDWSLKKLIPKSVPKVLYFLYWLLRALSNRTLK